MTTIAHQAQQMSLLLGYGVLTCVDVIEWSDSAIIKMDLPLPDALLELSLTQPQNMADIISHLRELSLGSDFWAAMRSVMPQLREFVVEHPDRAEVIANHLFQTACRAGSELPKDLQLMYIFEGAFELAREGIWGEPLSVYRDFVLALDKFRSSLSQEG